MRQPTEILERYEARLAKMPDKELLSEVRTAPARKLLDRAELTVMEIVLRGFMSRKRTR